MGFYTSMSEHSGIWHEHKTGKKTEQSGRQYEDNHNPLKEESLHHNTFRLHKCIKLEVINPSYGKQDRLFDIWKKSVKPPLNDINLLGQGPDKINIKKLISNLPLVGRRLTNSKREGC